MVEIPVVTCDEEYFAAGPPDTSTTEPTTIGSTLPPSTITTESTPAITTDSPTTEETTMPTTEPMTPTPTTTTTTEPSTTSTTTEITTTEEPTTTTTTTSTTTTTTTTTTEPPTTTTTVTTTTEEPTPTEAKPPTPTTYFPATSVPTPPNTGTIRPIVDVQNSSNTQNDTGAAADSLQEKLTNKNYVTSAAFRHRQLRNVNEYTYHCYKVLADVNGTMVTNRGCSRVKTMESVCGQYREEHPKQQLNKCYPCSNSRCNGSTALSVSISALILALIAVLLQRQ
ncbi:integumentary mucin C.1-like [Musca vetustissima]|uniref:integumentary mucin C.1-like n=1 Tax=Musca vetustissima TaxID=27455 RepID=UPI002AB74411|nr:integumentary mucin C.1-like [Musca vetustissima]